MFCSLTKGITPDICRLCFCPNKWAFFSTFYVFGYCFRMLAVILVSDFFIFFVRCFCFCGNKKLQQQQKCQEPELNSAHFGELYVLLLHWCGNILNNKLWICRLHIENCTKQSCNVFLIVLLVKLSDWGRIQLQAWASSDSQVKSRVFNVKARQTDYFVVLES